MELVGRLGQRATREGVERGYGGVGKQSAEDVGTLKEAIVSLCMGKFG